MKDFRGAWREASGARAAGPEASEPLVTWLGAFTALPAPPRPVAMYIWRVETDGCGSTIEYLCDIVVFVCLVIAGCVGDVVAVWLRICEYQNQAGTPLGLLRFTTR